MENMYIKFFTTKFKMVDFKAFFCNYNDIINIMKEMFKDIVKYNLRTCFVENNFLNHSVEKNLKEKFENRIDEMDVSITWYKKLRKYKNIEKYS